MDLISIILKTHNIIWSDSFNETKINRLILRRLFLKVTSGSESKCFDFVYDGVN